jgi:hypothetical protein
MGLRRLGVGVERCDILRRGISRRRLGVNCGNPRYGAAALTVRWKNLSYVPAEVSERVAQSMTLALRRADGVVVRPPPIVPTACVT